MSIRHPGHPFASLVLLAVDRRGQPLVLISRLAVHTRNLEVDPRASILVSDVQPGGDPLGSDRVTLLGRARRLDADSSEATGRLYIERHPAARAWIGFGDFAFWRDRKSRRLNYSH